MNQRFHLSAPTPQHRRTSVSLAVNIALATLGLTLVSASRAQAEPARAPSAAQTTLPAVKVTGQQETYDVKRATTATKTDTPLLDTPQSVSVVSKQELQDRSVQSLAEAAAYVPGVGFAQGEGNRETPIFRGISTTGDFFVDGIRDDVQYYRDLYNIERVEVFRGPNAMIFGRGATGGLINRVSKQAEWAPFYGGSLTLGSNENRRLTLDVNTPINENLAFRVNGLYENSGSHRNGVELERAGINPTVSWKSGATLVTAGYEYFKDDRIADRGISSYQGRPVDTDPSTFFGNAAGSPTWSRLDAFTLGVQHAFGEGVLLKNRLRFTDQDKFYQNVFPGAVVATGPTPGTEVAISAYNNATSRKSWFNQTDLTVSFQAAGMKHTVLTGVELGQQDTDNFRNTGFFPPGSPGCTTATCTSTTVPLTNPVTNLPVTYSQSATDANNAGKATVAALYVQDQIELTRQLQVIAGLRFDRFEVDFVNNRNGERFNPADNLLSPRLGVIFKPFDAMSLYANYSVAYQPRAGEQLSSLSASNAAFDPEKFKSYEVGAKWDVNPRLSATAAVYRLDRTNVAVPDPLDATRTILVDGQRSEGVELGIAGQVTPAWNVSGGYSYIDASLLANTSTTLRAGARLGQTPRHTFALWNRYDFSPRWGAGLGVIRRASMLASTEATSGNVTLPGYTRVDGAVFMKVSDALNVQLNVENLFDKKYYINAHSNTNITPGAPRAFRVALNAQF